MKEIISMAAIKWANMRKAKLEADYSRGYSDCAKGNDWKDDQSPEYDQGFSDRYSGEQQRTNLTSMQTCR